MNTVVLGAGALGTVLGAHLAKAGEEVTLSARGNRAAHLQEHGATMTGLAAQLRRQGDQFASPAPAHKISTHGLGARLGEAGLPWWRAVPSGHR